MKAPTSRSDTSSERIDYNDSDADGHTMHLMYEIGAMLNLTAHNLSDRLLTVRILKLYRPFSLACVMKVEILSGLSHMDSVPPRAVLKLYDRRFAANLRGDHKVAVWTPEIEGAYVDFVDRGAATKFIETLRQPEYLEEPESGWGPAESEAYLQDWCSHMCTAEIDTYRQLKLLQGDQIPEFYSSAAVQLRPQGLGLGSPPSSKSALLQVPGLLIEHISGPTLAQMPDFIPPKYWQAIVDEALNIVHLCSDQGVVNEGVSPENIIATPASANGDRHRVVMLDFSKCDIRPADQSDGDWTMMKADLDEEGILGSTMSAILKKVGFELRYVPSNRFSFSQTRQ